jgi:zinc protease
MPVLYYVTKMIKKIILISLLAFFVLGAFVHAPLNAQDNITLDNGLKAIVREDHRNPIVVFSVFTDSGSASEGEYAGTGISHLIEHMLFKGTKKYPVGSIEDILNKYGGNIEGFTSYDYTGYSVTILKDHLDKAMEILKDMITNPLFDRNELKKEMAVIEREMDMNKDDPARRIFRMMFETAFLDHPYRLPAIGYKESFERLKREDVAKFFKAAYAPEKITIAVVGDVDSQDTLDKIKAVFGDMPRGAGAFTARPKERRQITKRLIEEKADVEGAYMNIGFHSTDLLDKDLYAMDLLAFILGQGESSLLNENLRMKNQTVLSVSAYNYTPRDPGLFVISSVLKEENVNKAIEETLGLIEGLKQNNVNENDILKAKNNLIADYIYQKETIGSQANDIAQSQILTGSPDFFKQYVENIKAVKAEDIKQAVLKYLNVQNMSVIVLSKSGNALKTADAPDSAGKNTADIKKILLSNNISVILSENHNLPIIAAVVLFKGGVRAENKDNNGISMLASQMFLDGTSSMPRADMAGFYESNAINLSTFSGNNSLGITMTCLKEHAEDALNLISDICLNPSFPDDELNREKNEISQAIDMQDNDVVNHGHRLLKKLLFKTHPYGFQTIGTHESVNKITRDTVRDFYKNIVSADNIVIGVSGDFKSGEMSGLIEKYFSRISREGGLKPLLAKEPVIEKIAENKAGTNKDQSLVLIGFRGIDVYDKDRYAVSIMSDMLSNSSGVLFSRIRGEKGLTYAVGAFNVLGVDPGYLAVYALTSKENVKKVKQGLFKELDLFAKSGIKKDDIEKTKNYLKAMRKVEMQTNSGFIFNSAIDELYGIGYDDYKNFDKNIDSVTIEDVKAAAGRILTLDKCAVVILRGK